MKCMLRALFLSIFLTSFLGNPGFLHAKPLEVKDDFPMKVSLKPIKGGKSGDLHSVVKGKKLMIVDFWASWCGPCGEAMPALNALEKKYKNKGLIVVGINVDENIDDGLKFLTENKVDFKILYDEKKTLIEKVEVKTMPSSYLIDSKGKIVYVHKGFRAGDEKKYEKEILAHLPKK